MWSRRPIPELLNVRIQVIRAKAGKSMSATPSRSLTHLLCSTPVRRSPAKKGKVAAASIGGLRLNWQAALTETTQAGRTDAKDDDEDDAEIQVLDGEGFSDGDDSQEWASLTTKVKTEPRMTGLDGKQVNGHRVQRHKLTNVSHFSRLRRSLPRLIPPACLLVCIPITLPPATRARRKKFR